MLLGITRLQPELSADHSETFHLCYRIFRWIIANFTRWNTKLRRNISIDFEWICRFSFSFFFLFFFVVFSSPLFSFSSRSTFPSVCLPLIFDLRPVEITFSTPFPPSIRKLICRNGEETLVCLLFNPFERRNVTNERTGIKGFSTSILIAPAREEEILPSSSMNFLRNFEPRESLSTRRQTVAAAAASYYRYSIARRIKRRSSEWHEIRHVATRFAFRDGMLFTYRNASKRIRR